MDHSAKQSFNRIQALLNSEDQFGVDTPSNNECQVLLLFEDGFSMEIMISSDSSIADAKNIAVKILKDEGMGRYTAEDLQASTYNGLLADNTTMNEFLSQSPSPEIYISIFKVHDTATIKSSSSYSSGLLHGKNKDLYVSPYRARTLPVASNNANLSVDSPEFTGNNDTPYMSISLPDGTPENRCQCLLDLLHLQRHTTAGKCPLKAPNRDHQSEAARLLADTAQAELESLSDLENSAEPDIIAERDLWSLLDVICRNELLQDLSPNLCDSTRDDALAKIPVSTGALAIEKELFDVDLRVRKGTVLLNWLENAALHRAEEVQVEALPLEATLQMVRNGTAHNNIINSAHPDALFSENDGLLAILPEDISQQTALMKSLWSLVRSGEIHRAQELAHSHGMYWLATCLCGTDEGYYESSQNLMKTERLCGNSRRSIWQRTALKYSEKLAAAAKKVGASTDNESTAYEVAIFAALSGNLPVLLESNLLEDWSDRLWAVVKTAHSCNVASAVSSHRQRQSRHSELYVDCETTSMSAMDELEQKSIQMGLDGSVRAFNGQGLFRMSREPQDSCKSSDQKIMLRLQAAIIAGRTGLNDWIKDELGPSLREDSGEWETPRILRVCCHVCLWIRLSAESNDPSVESLASLPALTDLVFFKVIENYAAHLIQRGHHLLVAPYCVFLSSPRRVQLYVYLLRSISPTQTGPDGTQDSPAYEALDLARDYFDPGEVMQIASEAAKSTAQPNISYTMIDSLEGSNKNIQDVDVMQEDDTEETLYIVDERMQRLQWLLSDQRHRIEAVQQACLVASSIVVCSNDLLRNSRTLADLLQNRLPADAVECGWALIRLERKHLQETRCSDNEKKALSFREQRWRACLLQLKFWQDYVQACEDYESTNNAAKEAAAASRSVQAAQRLQNSAERSLEFILNALCGDANSGDGCGASAVWHKAEAAAVCGAKLAVLSSTQELQEADYVSLPSVEELSNHISSASEEMAELFPENPETSVDSRQNECRMRLRSELLQVISTLTDHLNKLQVSPKLNIPAARSHLNILVKSLQNALSEVRAARTAGVTALRNLIILHLKVCQTAASVSSIETSSYLYWHSRICAMADVLADPDPTLQLYDVLPKNDLSSIMNDLARSASEVINGKGCFQLQLN